MNITGRLAEALLDEANPQCDRCSEPAVVQLDVSGATGAVIGRSWLCRACHTDFCWFMITPPETPGDEPDISLGIIAEPEEVDDGPSTT